MHQPEIFTALILIKAASTVIGKRRKMESFCGYPSDYGGDELLLEKMNEFLSNPGIAHELTDAIEFNKKFSKT